MTPTNEMVLAGYYVACRYGVKERRAFEMVEAILKAALASKKEAGE